MGQSSKVDQNAKTQLVIAQPKEEDLFFHVIKVKDLKEDERKYLVQEAERLYSLNTDQKTSLIDIIASGHSELVSRLGHDRDFCHAVGIDYDDIPNVGLRIRMGLFSYYHAKLSAMESQRPSS